MNIEKKIYYSKSCPKCGIHFIHKRKYYTRNGVFWHYECLVLHYRKLVKYCISSLRDFKRKYNKTSDKICSPSTSAFFNFYSSADTSNFNFINVIENREKIYLQERIQRTKEELRFFIKILNEIYEGR